MSIRARASFNLEPRPISGFFATQHRTSVADIGTATYHNQGPVQSYIKTAYGRESNALCEFFLLPSSICGFWMTKVNIHITVASYLLFRNKRTGIRISQSSTAILPIILWKRTMNLQLLQNNYEMTHYLPQQLKPFVSAECSVKINVLLNWNYEI